VCEFQFVTYVIAQPCVDVMDRACVDECPVDCIYEGARSLYIQPDECVDCGACEPVCPVEAIYYEDDLADPWTPYLTDNDAFFSETLAGRAAPLGSPRGAAKVARSEWYNFRQQPATRRGVADGDISQPCSRIKHRWRWTSTTHRRRSLP
jgi:NAD-dependent dihydropyrimidine dehydrogenase PreA subunit